LIIIAEGGIVGVQVEIGVERRLLGPRVHADLLGDIKRLPKKIRPREKEGEGSDIRDQWEGLPWYFILEGQ
jgi:hypothetical protein